MKKELKQWENDFLLREGRKPRKEDISQNKAISKRQVQPLMYSRYKEYAKLKNAAKSPSASEEKASSKVKADVEIEVAAVDVTAHVSEKRDSSDDSAAQAAEYGRPESVGTRQQKQARDIVSDNWKERKPENNDAPVQPRSSLESSSKLDKSGTLFLGY